ncbi:MAG: tryptophan--tRNA ligase [Candidatus Micrarchaeales archaeon]
MAEKIELDAWKSTAPDTENTEVVDRLIKQFGLSTFTEQERKRYDNMLFRRGIVIAHRDFKLVEDRIKQNKPFIQMTGVACSGPMHLGHKVDIDLFLYFKSQGAKCYFCVADIDGYVSRGDDKVQSLQKAKEIAVDNVADALALGVDEKDIYVQSRKEQRYYEFTFELTKKFTFNTLFAIYGDDYNPGKNSANMLQYSDIMHQQLREFNGPMPSLTGIGVDQDPHARAVRDVASRLPYGFVAPSFIYFSFQPSLQLGKKMSSSDPASTILLSDTAEEAKKKIRNAYSGGKDTLAEHKKLGGVPEIDRAFQILRYHNTNDKLVSQIYTKFKSGDMTSGELKDEAIRFTTEFLKKHQEKKKHNMKTAEKIVFG